MNPVPTPLKVTCYTSPLGEQQFTKTKHETHVDLDTKANHNSAQLCVEAFVEDDLAPR